MKKLILSVFVFTSLNYSLLAQATVSQYTTDDMAIPAQDAKILSERYSGEQVLIAYDIDNTLLAPLNNGSPAQNCDLMTTQWWDWQAQLISTNSSSSFRVANDMSQLTHINNTLLPLMHLATFDTHLEQALQLEQETLHNKVIAISARDVSLHAASISQLTATTIDFSSSALGDANGIAGYITSSPFTRAAQYNHGIFSLSGQDKGKALNYLIDYYSIQPIKAIIFIDDGKKNIANVSNAFQNASIEVHTYLYTKEDARVAAFNADDKTHVDAQWLTIKAALKDSFDMDLSKPSKMA